MIRMNKQNNNVFLLELTTDEQFNQDIQAMKDYCNNTLYDQFFPRIIEINVEREDRTYFKKEEPDTYQKLKGVLFPHFHDSKFVDTFYAGCLPIYPKIETFDNSIILCIPFIQQSSNKTYLPIIAIGAQILEYAKTHFKKCYYDKQMQSNNNQKIVLSNETSVNHIYFENTFNKGINKEIQDYKAQHPLNERKQKYFERLIEPKKEKMITQINQMLQSKNYQERIRLAEQGQNLDILVNDENWKVRREVANQGYGLEKLVNDRNWKVRQAVARHGYGLEQLVHDKSIEVKKTLIKHGYCIDELTYDKDYRVRQEIASHGYNLNILVNDPHNWVREEVALLGYGLDILINDTDPNIRLVVASQGYGLDQLVNDPDPEVRQCAKEKRPYAYIPEQKQKMLKKLKRI